MSTCICQYCNKILHNPGALKVHELSCIKNPHRKNFIYINNGIITIKIDKKDFDKYPGFVKGLIKKQGLGTKQKKKIHKGDKTKFVSEQELIEYLSNGWILGFKDDIRQKITNINRNRERRGQASTEEKEIIRRNKISETMKNNPNGGGKRIGSGRGKKGWYKGIFCDSSWELAFVIYYTDHNLNIKRYTNKLKYIFNNIEHTYIPDFITDEGIIEIKGYKTKQWEAKLKQHPYIIPIYRDKIQFYIDYVVQKYGKNYIDLYEK